MTLLSVNINKIAVLRNSRGGAFPDPVRAALAALAAGCHGITVHPRPDQRHIRVDDIVPIAAVLGNAEYNIEGNPVAAPRGSYPGLLELVRRTHPAQVTLVPDGDGQITSDHGFDVVGDAAPLREQIAAFRSEGCRVSVFVDAGMPNVGALADFGAHRIEIYTGPFAEAHARGDCSRELEACRVTAEHARAAGLGINAGHDLSQQNLAALLGAVPHIDEVSIGHALFAEAIYAGLDATVKAYLAILARHA